MTKMMIRISLIVKKLKANKINTDNIDFNTFTNILNSILHSKT